MKKQVKAYFKYWLDFYGADPKKYESVMIKVEELFKVFDECVSEEIQSTWKVNRKNLLKYDD